MEFEVFLRLVCFSELEFKRTAQHSKENLADSLTWRLINGLFIWEDINTSSRQSAVHTELRPKPEEARSRHPEAMARTEFLYVLPFTCSRRMYGGGQIMLRAEFVFLALVRCEMDQTARLRIEGQFAKRIGQAKGVSKVTMLSAKACMFGASSIFIYIVRPSHQKGRVAV